MPNINVPFFRTVFCFFVVIACSLFHRAGFGACSFYSEIPTGYLLTARLNNAWPPFAKEYCKDLSNIMYLCSDAQRGCVEIPNCSSCYTNASGITPSPVLYSDYFNNNFYLMNNLIGFSCSTTELETFPWSLLKFCTIPSMPGHNKSTEPCPIGTYNPNFGGDCIACPSFYGVQGTTAAPGAISINECYLPTDASFFDGTGDFGFEAPCHNDGVSEEEFFEVVVNGGLTTITPNPNWLNGSVSGACNYTAASFYKVPIRFDIISGKLSGTSEGPACFCSISKATNKIFYLYGDNVFMGSGSGSSVKYDCDYYECRMYCAYVVSHNVNNIVGKLGL